MVPTAKRALSFEQIDAQTAVELPDRDMMALVNILIFDVVEDTNVNVQVPVSVAVNVCDVNVAAVIAAIRDDGEVDCTAHNTTELPARFQN
jgi:hypothetical protein